MTAMPEKQPREQYIPLAPAELMRKLADEPAVTIFEREQFYSFCQLVEALLHEEARRRLKELKAAYGPFDPDDEAAARCSLTEDERAAQCVRLFADFDALMQRANYRRLAREEIEEAIRSPMGTG